MNRNFATLSINRTIFTIYVMAAIHTEHGQVPHFHCN